MASDVRLIVNGRRYGGWTSVRITRSIESIAGSFSLSARDRWAEGQEPWPLREEDTARLEIDDERVIDGAIEAASLELSDTTSSSSVSGYDKARVLVRCSSLPDRWTFRKIGTLDFLRLVAGQFGVPVRLDQGTSLPDPPRKYVIDPGDTAFDAMVRAARMAGVLLVSDGDGVLVTRSGSVRGQPLLQGISPIKNLRSSRDLGDRYHRYVILAQRSGDDETSGNALRVRAEALDEGVRQAASLKVIRAPRGMNAALAQQLADWTARTRAAASETVEVSLVGWRQGPKLPLWKPNIVVSVELPAIDVAGDLLITSVTLSLDDRGGEVTSLRLTRPDAYLPQPRLPASRLRR